MALVCRSWGLIYRREVTGQQEDRRRLPIAFEKNPKIPPRERKAKK
jgi:hypothetical protein